MPTEQRDYTPMEVKMLQEISSDVKFLLLILKRTDIPKDIADQANDRFWKLQKLAELITARKRKEARADGRDPPPPLMVDNRTRYVRAEERLKKAGLFLPKQQQTQGDEDND